MGALLRAWQVFLEVLFPPVCLNCRAYLPQEERADLLCSPCLGGIKLYSNIFYPEPRFSLLALASYENAALRELLHYFKYNGFLACQAPLEKLVLKWLEINRPLIPNILTPNSCLVPIPLHKSRLRKRGFNQAELVAQILSRHLGLTVEKKLLERVRDTKSQTKMQNAKERQENVKNSFRLKGEPQSENIILVDDIFTSGSTMMEAVKTCRQAGIKEVKAFVVAKA